MKKQPKRIKSKNHTSTDYNPSDTSNPTEEPAS